MSSRPFRLPAAILVAFTLTAAASIAQEPPPRQFSEATSQAFAKLKPLQDAKNWDGMIAVLDAIPNVGAESYDRAQIQDMKAKLYLAKEQYAKAIGPWEDAVRLGDKYKFFDARDMLDKVYYLAQLYSQEATNEKNPVKQAEFFQKATSYFKRWLNNTKKPTPEAMVTYASILYYRAVADPKKPDMALLKEAQAEVEKGLRMTVVPKDSFYALLLSILQQENDFARSAEIIELLLKQNPQKKDFWAVLMATYLNLANEKEKNDPEEYRSYLCRTIVTVERAQALGFLNSPKDCMNLVSFYLMAGQGNAATDYLYNGLKSGKIESDPKTWMNLGLIYQQNNKELQAISVLKEAAKLYPNNGQFDYLIGEIYRAVEKTREAFNQYKEAIRKGGLDKPHVVHQLLSYSAFELGDLDEALKAVKQAETFPEGKKDAQLPRLRQAIEDAIKERQYNLEQAQKKAKATL
ncbi:MAG: tetratricopeptide repeat protein [Verrucomicrobia bacterium]|nr:tetratricopeptide repeat protein [Verrucomicrobiota bacterium]